MSNELVNVEETGNALIDNTMEVTGLLSELGVSKYATKDALSTVVSSGYLPYIQLMSGTSGDVTEGKIPVGTFVLVRGSEKIQLGKEFVCMVLGWRPKAMQFEPTLSVFDVESEQFKNIMRIADSNPQAGCAYGPEFLVWLPDQGEFAHYFMGNKTGRNESSNMIRLIDKRIYVGKVKSQLLDNGKYKWHGPVTLGYDHPITMPDRAALAQVLNAFNNPPVQEQVEKAEEATGSTGRE